tara:strand:+ start:254 stop:760 length:507 start_codon:yes stop_codon:yes gene_type:complete
MGLDVSACLIVGFPVDGIKFWNVEELPKKTCDIRQEDGKGHETTNLEASYCETCGKKLKRVTAAVATKAFKKLCKELNPDETPEWVWEGWKEGYDCGVGLWASKDDVYGERDLFGIKLGRTDSHRHGGEGFTLYKGELDKAFQKMESYHKTLKASGTIRLYVVLRVSC